MFYQRLPFHVPRIVVRGPFKELQMRLMHISTRMNSIAKAFSFAIFKPFYSDFGWNVEKDNTSEIDGRLRNPIENTSAQNKVALMLQISAELSVPLFR